MNQEDINTIQAKIIALLNSQGEGILSVLSCDCCSEVARLVGSWVQEIQTPDKMLIFKGQNLRNHDCSHDIIAIFKDTKISVIDPTVWQFFTDKNIFVGDFEHLEETFSKLSKVYGGQWEISEELNDITDVQKKEWERIIKKTLTENLAELKENV